MISLLGKSRSQVPGHRHPKRGFVAALPFVHLTLQAGCWLGWGDSGGSRWRPQAPLEPQPGFQPSPERWEKTWVTPSVLQGWRSKPARLQTASFVLLAFAFPLPEDWPSPGRGCPWFNGFRASPVMSIKTLCDECIGAPLGTDQMMHLEKEKKKKRDKPSPCFPYFPQSQNN